MTTYAKRTKVVPGQTRDEIAKTLLRFGARAMRYYEDDEQAVIGFSHADLDVAITMPMTGSEQEVAARWRSLGLAIKGKLALIDCGGSTFEREFLADVQMPDGSTGHEAYRRHRDGLRQLPLPNVIELPDRSGT